MEDLPTFSFSEEDLPQDFEKNAAFVAAFKMFKEALSNLEVIRYFANYYDPPPRFRVMVPTTNPADVSVAKLKEIQQWMASTRLVMRLSDLPGMYARYHWNIDVIQINIKFWNAAANSTRLLRSRFQFLMWCKLMHEFAYRVLYLRVLHSDPRGAATPPGLFGSDCGNMFENTFFGGVFTHVGVGFTTCPEVHVLPRMSTVSLVVPDDWIIDVNAADIRKDPLEICQILGNWPVVKEPKKRKRAVGGGEEEFDEKHEVAIYNSETGDLTVDAGSEGEEECEFRPLPCKTGLLD